MKVWPSCTLYLTLTQYCMEFDSLSLDVDLESLLLARCDNICGQTANLQPELHALARAILCYLASSRETGAATPGQALLGFRQVRCDALPITQRSNGPALETTRRHDVPLMRSLLHGTLVVILPWAWSRLSQFVTDPAHPERLRWARWVRRTEGCLSLASLAIMLHHLHTRRFPTLPMALAGIQLLPVLPGAPRRPSCEFMEQQACCSIFGATYRSLHALCGKHSLALSLTFVFVPCAVGLALAC